MSASEFHTVGEWPNTFNRNNTGTANIGYKISDSTQLRAVFRAYDAIAGIPGQIAYGIDDLVPNEHERDDTVSLRLDDSRGANYQQQFTFGFHRLTDRYNDDEPYGEQPLAALVQNVAGPPPAVYFVALVNPYNPPTVIPPGLTLVQTDALLRRRQRFAQSHRTENRGLPGHALLPRRRAGLRLRLSGPERRSFGRAGVAHQ